MSDEKHEECGVGAIYLKKNINYAHAPRLMYTLLWNLKNRGQKGSGFTVYNPGKPRKLNCHKDLCDPFTLWRAWSKRRFDKVCDKYQGRAIIGHVRYPTSGMGKDVERDIEVIKSEVQPFLRRHGRSWKFFSLAFNGNISNYDDIRKEMEADEYQLHTNVDTEVIQHLFSRKLNEMSGGNGCSLKPSMFDVTKEVMIKLEGAYNIVFLNGDGEMMVIRDGMGVKPLVWGENDYMTAFASESVALEQLGIDEFYPVRPGSCYKINDDGMEVKDLISSNRLLHCFFEWAYFSQIASVIDDKSVYSFRNNCADELVGIEPFKNQISENKENWIVVPIPESGKAYAQQFAFRLGLRYTEALVNLGGGRGFINDRETRKNIMERKYGRIREAIRGKNILLVDDTNVRGETGEIAINAVKRGDPESIHLRYANPPIVAPCFQGTDMSSYNELLVNNVGDYKSLGELEELLAKKFNVNTLKYLPLELMIKASGFAEDELCLSCLNNKYLIPSARQQAERQYFQLKTT